MLQPYPLQMLHLVPCLLQRQGLLCFQARKCSNVNCVVTQELAMKCQCIAVFKMEVLPWMTLELQCLRFVQVVRMVAAAQLNRE